LTTCGAIAGFDDGQGRRTSGGWPEAIADHTTSGHPATATGNTEYGGLIRLADDSDTGTERSGSRGSTVAPSRADIEAARDADAREADRKDAGEQLVDEIISTVRFTLSLGAFAASFLLIGAGLFWPFQDLVGVQLGQVGRYGLLVLTLPLALYATHEFRNLGRFLRVVVRG